jgi:apolipoprotein N-acyltransferase
MNEDKPIALSRAVVLAAFSALLLALAFPYAAQHYLVFVALVPFYLAVWGQGARRGALLGFIHGFSFQGYLLFWSTFFGLPAWLFLATYKAILPLAAGAYLGAASPVLPWGSPAVRGGRTGSPRGRMLMFGLVWVSLEYLHTFTPFGMTWGMLAQALVSYPTWLQITAYLGPWGLSAVIVAVNCVIAESIRSRRVDVPSLGAVLGMVAVVLGLGLWRLGNAPPLGEGGVKVAAVQVNMGRDVKWDPSFAEVALGYLNVLTKSAAIQGAHLVIWPETAIPYRNFSKSPGLTYRIGMLARAAHSFLVVGSIEMMGDAANHTLNTVSLVSPEGGFLARYDKQRLVPGGEYLPFETPLRHFSIFDRVMNYAPGVRPGVFTFNVLPGQTMHLGALICFESMVPNIARDRVKEGADTLFVSTNDGWFGGDGAIEHHFDIGVMRAVEVGRPMIQSGNTGISGMTDSYGRVVTRTRANERGVAVGNVLPSSEITWYVRIGDLLPWLALLGLLAWEALRRSRRP